jgi:hypothetical protein
LGIGRFFEVSLLRMIVFAKAIAAGADMADNSYPLSSR